MTKAKKPKHTIEINAESDFSMEELLGNDWTVFSFCSKHCNYVSRDTYFSGEGKLLYRHRKRFSAGNGFALSYFEHSNCVWSLQGEGPYCKFDSVHTAGVALRTYFGHDYAAMDYEARKADCREFMDRYTDWANGAVHTIVVKDKEDEIVDSATVLGDSSKLAETIRAMMSKKIRPETTVVLQNAPGLTWEDIFK